MPNYHIKSQAETLCQCPVDWQNIPGYNADDDDVVRVLHREWVRTYSCFCVDEPDLSFLEGVALGDVVEEEVIDMETFKNLQERVPLAKEEYLRGIGRIGSMKFITPSEHGKHYSISGVKPAGKKKSYFYNDYTEGDLWTIFWFWFGNAFALDEKDGSLEKFPEFALNANDHWKMFCREGSFRICLNSATSIGELNRRPLQHFCIDIELEGIPIAHAYPVTGEEAEKISKPLNVITANFSQIIGRL